MIIQNHVNKSVIIKKLINFFYDCITQNIWYYATADLHDTVSHMLIKEIVFIIYIKVNNLEYYNIYNAFCSRFYSKLYCRL